MTRTEVAIHDIADALLGVDNGTLNRDKKCEIYIKTLESLIRFAISEHQVDAFRHTKNDLAAIEQIRKSALKN